MSISIPYTSETEAQIIQLLSDHAQHGLFKDFSTDTYKHVIGWRYKSDDNIYLMYMGKSTLKSTQYGCYVCE